MGRHTIYSGLSIDELLTKVDATRHLSPIIDELCNRLESRGLDGVPDSGRRVECPVCEAALDADYDEANDQFTIKIAVAD